MNKLSIWIQACRPQTLIASISPIAIGTSAAATAGFRDPLTLLFTVLTALGIQILTNLANDYFDFFKGADTSDRKGPTRITQAMLVSPFEMKLAISLILALTTLCALYLIAKGGAVIAIMFCISILLGFGYTAGPFALAYQGLGDVFAFSFFGPLAAAGTYYLQTNVISPMAFIYGIGPGLFSTALLTINNLRDIEEDRKARKNTLCVRFGHTFGKREFALCMLAPLILPIFLDIYLPLVLLIPAYSVVKTTSSTNNPLILNAQLPKTALIMGLYTVLFSYALI